MANVVIWIVLLLLVANATGGKFLGKLERFSEGTSTFIDAISKPIEAMSGLADTISSARQQVYPLQSNYPMGQYGQQSYNPEAIAETIKRLSEAREERKPDPPVQSNSNSNNFLLIGVFVVITNVLFMLWFLPSLKQQQRPPVLIDSDISSANKRRKRKKRKTFTKRTTISKKHRKRTNKSR